MSEESYRKEMQARVSSNRRRNDRKIKKATFLREGSWKNMTPMNGTMTMDSINFRSGSLANLSMISLISLISILLLKINP